MIEPIKGWPVTRVGTTSTDALAIARLESCVEMLRELGVVPHPSSRLPQAIRLLRELRLSPEKLRDPGVRELVVEAQRLAWELMVVCYAAIKADRSNTVFTREKLELALQGAPTADESNSVGRNTQFELYVPALYQLAGFEIVPGPADARWIIGGEALDIEAKRVRSLTQVKLEDNLKKAADQILGEERPGRIEVVRGRGIIAVNLDVHFESLAPAPDTAELVRRFEAGFEILNRAGRVLAHRHGIRGVLALGCTTQWTLFEDEGRLPHLTISYPIRWASLVGTDPAELGEAERLNKATIAIERVCISLDGRAPRRRAP